MASENQKRLAVPNPNAYEEPESSSSDTVSRNCVKDPLKLVLQIAYFSIIFIPLFVWAMVSNFFTKRKSIRDKVVLVTGSGRGLGRSLALKFAELNCKIACASTTEANNAETVRLIKQKYPTVKAIAYKCNVSLIDDIKKLSENISNDLGEVDILVNNAGIMSGAPIIQSELDTNYVDAMLDVNLKSHFLMIGTFLPKMMDRNSGHIVAISSIMGCIGGPNGAAYSATKHGIIGLMESLYDELRTVPNNKIQSTCVCPYFTNTNEVYIKSWDARIPAITMKQATNAIIDAILTNKTILTVPSYMYYSFMLMRCLPVRLRNMAKDIFYVRVNVSKMNTANNIATIIENSVNRRKQAITKDEVV